MIFPKIMNKTWNFDTRIQTFDAKYSKYQKSDNHPNSDTYLNSGTFLASRSCHYY